MNANRPNLPRTCKSESTDFPGSAKGAIRDLLCNCGFTFDVDTLNRFIVRSVQLREAVKLEFTKNLSNALSLLVEFGKYHGLTRESLAFAPIDTYLTLANRNFSEDWLRSARKQIDLNQKRYDFTCAIHLPDLIFSEADTQVISLQRRRPNFITQKRVIAECFDLDAEFNFDGELDLEGKIVLIENADPGYDWLFTKRIGALVTKYGGAASHMAIRCAEFGLPAAIGCGEQIFSQLRRVDSAILDCAERKIEENA